MVTYSSGFIGSFKLGDNIVHNLAIIRELYAYQKSATQEQSQLLIKPIVVLIGSVAKAILYDLYVVKIAKFTNEGVPSIPQNVLEETRDKTIDDFAKYIDNARSKSLLGASSDLYDSLNELRKLRNRVHIQNARGHYEPDESVAFNEARQREAETTLEQMIAYMCANHLRTPKRQYVPEFELPWNTRLVAAS
jgi:hypothetical protein